MTVLIAVASRHGSTYEIAQVIAAELRALELDVDLRDVADVDGVGGYDAVIIGSAIYMGNWLAEARRYIERTRDELVDVPVWLFSSGPLGHDDPRPPDGPCHLDDLLTATAAREHQLFVGKLDKHALGPAERLMVRVVKAPEGDFRDWAAIRAWAREIGASLWVEHMTPA